MVAIRLVVTALLTATGVANAQQQFLTPFSLFFDVQLINTFGDIFTPFALDENGTVVGETDVGLGNTRGGYYDSNLGYFQTGAYLAGSVSSLRDVSNGIAVGSGDGAGNTALSYDPINGFTDLDSGSLDDSNAVAINSSGQVLFDRYYSQFAGYDQNGQPQYNEYHSSYLYENGIVSPLWGGTFNFEEPVDLNDAGFFVLTDLFGNGIFGDLQATVVSGLTYDLNPVTPSALNNNNVVGGTVNGLPFVDVDPFADADGIFIDLLDPAHTSGDVIGLNDGDMGTDLLVTFSSTGPGGTLFGIWDPNNGSQNIVDLLDYNSPVLQGVSSVEILAVTNPNNLGQIAIAALLDGEHTTLLLNKSVVPELNALTTSGIAAAAIIAIVAQNRRRRFSGICS